MTVIKNAKQFDRAWTIAAGFLSMLALVLAMIALRTSSWTINQYSPNAAVEWHGLFWRCDRMKCHPIGDHYFVIIFVSIIGALFLLVSAVFIFLMGVHSFPRRHFYITPLLTYIASLLLYAALMLYAGRTLINGISARLMVTGVVFAFTSLAMIMYVSGRYSILYKKNPSDFYYTKAETNENGGNSTSETIKKNEEQQLPPQLPADI